MNSDLTNVYEILKSNFGSLFEKLNLQNNKELASFLYYNAHNQMAIRADQDGIIFRNLDTISMYRAFSNGDSIYFFPVGNKNIEPKNDFVAFSLSDMATAVIVNGRGLFIEKNNLKNRICTRFYDSAALFEISREHISIEDIDELESYINRMGIREDMLIVSRRDENNVTINLIENNEIIKSESIIDSGRRTLYSLHHEFIRNCDSYIVSQMKWPLKLTK